MYGVNEATAAGVATTSGAGAGILAQTGAGNLWIGFAAITLIFAGVALRQLVSRPAEHRP